MSVNVFNSTHMNQAVFAFRRYEDVSLSYTGIESHEWPQPLRAVRRGWEARADRGLPIPQP